MKTNVIIRPLQSTDGTEIIRFQKALFHDYPPDEIEEESKLLLKANPAHWQTFVAEVNEHHLAGYICGSVKIVSEIVSQMRIGYVESWYVDIEYRRKGIGRMLYQTLEAWFRKMNCVQAMSDTNLENDISVKAHSGIGFKESERLILFTKKMGNDNGK